jgi:hypothetical protein
VSINYHVVNYHTFGLKFEKSRKKASGTTEKARELTARESNDKNNFANSTINFTDATQNMARNVHQRRTFVQNRKVSLSTHRGGFGN